MSRKKEKEIVRGVIVESSALRERRLRILTGRSCSCPMPCRGIEKIVKLQKGNPYSSKTIREHIKFAVIDQTLFQLLQDNAKTTKLREVLINSLDV